jgi:hypothetical protein
MEGCGASAGQRARRSLAGIRQPCFPREMLSNKPPQGFSLDEAWKQLTPAPESSVHWAS